MILETLRTETDEDSHTITHSGTVHEHCCKAEVLKQDLSASSRKQKCFSGSGV